MSELTPRQIKNFNEIRRIVISLIKHLIGFVVFFAIVSIVALIIVFVKDNFF